MPSHVEEKQIPVAAELQSNPQPAPAPASAAKRTKPCDSAKHREFDFWLGNWQVFTPDGKLVATNRIESRFDGCALQETYQTINGAFGGGSLNAFDATRSIWHQTWMDKGGTVLVIEGGLEGDAMVLRGPLLDAEGKSVMNEIRWQPKPDKSVIQTWTTIDAVTGEKKPVFVGIYRRTDEPATP
jgi:hypothetical protein